MKKFQIENTMSGLILGVYEGETAEDAHRAMLIDAGYVTEAEQAEWLEDADIRITEV